MVIINRYRLLKDNGGYLCVQSYEIITCPICSSLIVVIGTRKRSIINSDGEKQTLIIRRLRCKECRTIHHELPDIIVPYKRHCSETIEKIIADDTAGVNCESNTIHRIKAWWAACVLYFKSVLASLREKYGTRFSINPAPREIVRAIANANLWLHTRSEYLTG